MDEHAGVIEQVLDRVHRQTGPESDFLLKWLYVQQAMSPIEVEISPQADQTEDQDEVIGCSRGSTKGMMPLA